MAMDFRLITAVAKDGHRRAADYVEVKEWGHYNNKMQVWAVYYRDNKVVWTNWLYF